MADTDEHADHSPAGWYADPSGEPGALRYWSGKDWTEHRHEIPDRNPLAPKHTHRSRLPRPPRRRR
ncbi:MAG: DUF2510 domain-containing protein [Acidimicrobiales bacterium]